jgi:hypothetical protein
MQLKINYKEAKKEKRIETMKEEDPRWQLEGGSRQHEIHTSKILLRRWNHTWQKIPARRSKIPTP